MKEDMSLETWITFFFATCMLSISPGAGALICMNHGIEFGIRKTLITIIGLEIGGIVIFMIAGVGLGAALLSSKYIFFTLKIIGALYLIYLGVTQWRTPIRTIRSVKAGNQVPQMSNHGILLIGFLTNLTNLKGIIFMSAMLPQFIDPTGSLLSQLLILSITMVSVDFLVMHLYALLALRAERLLQIPKVMQWSNRIFGSLLIAIGITLFLSSNNQREFNS